MSGVPPLACAAAARPQARVPFRARVPRWESAEQRRVRVREQLLRAGADPAAWPGTELAAQALHAAGHRALNVELIGPDADGELDGIGARAARYHRDLARVRWALPAAHDLTTPSHPQEARWR